MIRVERAEPPEDFEEMVRAPGLRALEEMIGTQGLLTRPGRPRKAIAASVEEIPVSQLPDYWTRALPELRERYQHLCAYLAMRIHESTGWATVDHFVPKSVDRRAAYEWGNLRLSSARINTNKGERRDILDPFEVRDEWFELSLVTGEVRARRGLAPELHREVEHTLEVLKLNDAIYCQSRMRYFELYQGLRTDPDDPPEPLPFWYIEREAPFVAREIIRQDRLR